MMDLVYFYQQKQVKNVSFAVIVQTIKAIRTKRGDSMAFVQFSDENMEVEGVAFPDLNRQVKPWLEEQQFVRIKGKKEWRQGKEQIIVESMEPLDWTAIVTDTEPKQRLFIRIAESKLINSAIETIEVLATQYPGTIPVLIHQRSEERRVGQ